MYKTITLQLADGTEKEFPFKACATTPLRFRMIFKKELIASIVSIVNAAGADKLGMLMKTTQEAEAQGKDELALDEIDPETLKILISIAGSGELNAISELAFIMNKQAEGTDMTKLDIENYLDWLDQFETMEFLTHAMEFITLYMSNRTTTSNAKKGSAQLTGM